ncbi:MAG: hypothetical protein QOD03_398 [Verrucomicrobiota bacterium]|jgi:uncharacterized membrane protein (DUF2068 family)
MADPTPTKPRRAPTLYFIIAAKLVKGVLSLALAFGVYKMAGQDLQDYFERFIHWVKWDPENRFLSDVAAQLDQITPANVRRVALGTFLYSLFSLVEGVGLMFRVSWAGWLAIGESAFFIPIEIFELVHRGFSLVLFGILALNVLIVWYLFQNRKRLFKH